MRYAARIGDLRLRPLTAALAVAVAGASTAACALFGRETPCTTAADCRPPLVCRDDGFCAADPTGRDAGPPPDDDDRGDDGGAEAGRVDGGVRDAGRVDAGLVVDAGFVADAGLVGDAGFVVDAGGSDAGALDAGAGDAGSAPFLVEYASDYAECVDVVQLDPAACELAVHDGGMIADLAPSEIRIYLRFPLDGRVAGRAVLSASLVLVVTDEPNAGGPTSGEVHLVAPFTTAANGLPASQAVVASDLGAVVAEQTVLFTLTPGFVATTEPLHLGVHATSTDGVRYWNARGRFPPSLVLEVQ